MNLEKMIDDIIKREGSTYTNDPNDSGGPTKYGITWKTLGDYRGRGVTADDVKNLTEAEARSIYKHKYWIAPGFADVARHSLKVAEELLDTGVNAGPARAVMLLQRALNGLNNRGQLFPDMVEDGEIGPRTLHALRQYLAHRGKEGEVILLRYLNGLQVAHYDSISRSNQKNESFMYGWLANRVS